MTNLDIGYVFIWVGVGFTLIVAGIIISSIRRSLRRAQLSRIHLHTMTTFRENYWGRDLAKLIEEQLTVSWETKLASAPEPPTKAMWGWAPFGSELGEVNFHYVILSSPTLLEQAAKTRLNDDFGSRHPSQSMEDYLAMLHRRLPSMPEDSITSYLETYNTVLFELGEVSKRQYSSWLTHLTALLQILDQPSSEADGIHERTISSLEVTEILKKKKKRRRKD